MRLLLVEDQASLARALARAISRLRPEIEVVLATNGDEAIHALREGQHDIDLVLTDLRMPVMDGFELIAWLMEHHPAIPVFAMTAFASDETVTRLNATNTVHCFTKPLNLHGLLDRLTDELSQSVRGHVQNVSLASFLQLMEMERKTCTLTIHSEEKTGVLFMRRGQLVDARSGEFQGEEAAINVVTWPNPTITILNYCTARERLIDSPLGYILMEGMRLRDEADERVRGEGGSRDVGSQWPPRSFMPSEPVKPLNGSLPPSGLGLPGGARGIAVVDTATGKIRSSSSADGCPLAEVARMAALVLRRQLATLALFGNAESVEELVLSTKTRCDVIRPLGPAEFALLVFAPDETNLSMARLALERFVAARARA
jgi:CheY-like chemotaxis protein